jgi:hypothetical protein
MSPAVKWLKLFSIEGARFKNKLGVFEVACRIRLIKRIISDNIGVLAKLLGDMLPVADPFILNWSL